MQTLFLGKQEQACPTDKNDLVSLAVLSFFSSFFPPLTLHFTVADRNLNGELLSSWEGFVSDELSSVYL